MISSSLSPDLSSDPLGATENFVDLPTEEHQAYKATRQNCISEIEKCLAQGFDINTRQESPRAGKVYTIKWLLRQIRLKSYTLLHVAVVHGNLQTIEFLLSKGADIDLVDENFITPVSVATALQRADVVKRLIEAGADLNIQSVSGRTPLIQALTVQNLTLVQMLLAAGADPNLADSKGCTPLTTCLLAVDDKSVDILQALIQGGSKVDVPNRQGATPLMTAVGLGRREAVQVLVEAGADVNRVDRAGSNSLHFAVGPKLALYLVNQGAYLDLRDKNGQRPLDRAARVCHTGLLRLLLGADCERPSLDILEVPRVVQVRQSFPAFDLWIQRELYQPRELKRICRGTIRQALGPANLTRLDKLPVPNMVKDFILARGIDLTF